MPPRSERAPTEPGNTHGGRAPAPPPPPSPPPGSRLRRWLAAGGARHRRVRAMLSASAVMAVAATATVLLRARRPRRGAAAALGGGDGADALGPMGRLMLWMLDEAGEFAVESQLEELGLESEVEGNMAALRRCTAATGQKRQQGQRTVV